MTDRHATKHIVTRRLNLANKQSKEVEEPAPFPEGPLRDRITANLLGLLNGEITETIETPPKKKGGKPGKVEKTLMELVNSGEKTVIRNRQNLLDVLIDLELARETTIELSAHDFDLKEMAADIVKHIEKQAATKQNASAIKRENFKRPPEYGAGITEFKLPQGVDARGVWSHGE